MKRTFIAYRTPTGIMHTIVNDDPPASLLKTAVFKQDLNERDDRSLQHLIWQYQTHGRLLHHNT